MVIKQEERKYIIELGQTSDRNRERTRFLFKERFGYPVSNFSIGNIWKDAGIELNSHGGYRHGIQEELFNELYNRHSGDVIAISEEMGVSIKTIVNRCYTSRYSPKNVPEEFKKKSKRKRLCDKFIYNGI